MAGVPGRSGGHNRLPVEAHILRGTFRPDRHGARLQQPSAPISAADRQRTLRGLSSTARRLATALLDNYDNWDAASLETLRQYVLSCDRLRALEQASVTSMLYRELRANLGLLKALNLEAER
jgi:hypothetical protein